MALGKPAFVWLDENASYRVTGGSSPCGVVAEIPIQLDPREALLSWDTGEKLSKFRVSTKLVELQRYRGPWPFASERIGEPQYRTVRVCPVGPAVYDYALIGLSL